MAMASEVFADVMMLLGSLLQSIAGTMPSSGMSPRKPEYFRDFSVVTIMTISLFVMNWGVRLIFLERVVHAILPSMKRGSVVKFVQSVNELAFYGVFSLIGLRIVPSQSWAWPSSMWWQGTNILMSSTMRCYYLLYIARYLQSGFSVFLEPRRKDFWEMVIHHNVTVFLCTISYFGAHYRVGVVVMAMFDLADVPLHAAKLCKYTSDEFAECTTERRRWRFLADRVFEIFALVFFVTRLPMFGYVCWSSHVESLQFFPKDMGCWACIACLYTLLVLQFYWFGLLVKAVVRMIRVGNVEDVRSDDEDDEPSGTKKSQ
eukprot:TRINITY_DN8162_c0_g1_i1.p1 TRINITY_DN8162_c0_g1~~TRINITY_DN8162_c0_g1_i1.p1  ORF type:complete len:316 (-),score=32.81 TRINITY_DN8162_c0_g1_i1:73-1020(-)